jgi:type 1 glutamine amidotransferase
MMRKLVALLALCLGFPALSSSPAIAQGTQAKPRVLVFSHTTGYRHASIETGVAALKALGEREKFETVHTEDPEIFSAAALKDFDAIIFLSSTTDPKKPESEWFQGPKREAFQNFVRRGGGVVGIHAATDSHYHWPWYQQLMGAHFARHPQGTPEGTLEVVDPSHRANQGVDATMRRVDEWYYFDDYNPRMKLLMTLDPASIGEKDVNPNPVSWAHEFDGGRVFYTAMGHTDESFSDRNVLAHVAGGLAWVLERD